jgi:plasmid segregation protein ParM
LGHGAIDLTRREGAVIVGLDVGFGYTKTVRAEGVDVSPSVIGEWTPGAFRLSVDLGNRRDARVPEVVALDGRPYVVGERALRVAHRRFVGLSREWMAEPTFRVLALAALHRVLGEAGQRITIVTGLPVEDVDPHGDSVRRLLEGSHELRLEPHGRCWTVAIERVHVLPQPLGTVLAQGLDSRGHVADPAGFEGRVGVLDVGFRTTDYFTLDGLEVLPARSLTRNTGMADLLLDLSREVYRRWGVERDPHALDEATLRGVLQIGDAEVRLGPVLDPWLDRHADAIAAHARMLWGDQARDLRRLWITGGGSAVLGSRLTALAPHAAVVRQARIQNAVGYFRYGLRLARASETPAPVDR